MPNWCEQDLQVSTDEGENYKEQIPDVKAFKEHAKGVTRYGNSVDLYDGHFIPYPLQYALEDARVQAVNKHYNEVARSEGVFQMSDEDKTQYWRNHPRSRDKDGFNKGGYEWCCDNYGSKWGISDPKLEDEDLTYGYLEYKFKSAWSPVKPLVLKMSQLFPRLKFTLRYFEMGRAIHGIYVCHGGEVTEEKETEYFGQRGG